MKITKRSQKQSKPARFCPLLAIAIIGGYKLTLPFHMIYRERFRIIKYLLLIGFLALVLLFGWATVKVRAFIDGKFARGSGPVIMAISGELKLEQMTPLEKTTNDGSISLAKDRVLLDQIPTHLAQSILTIEDRRFYDHFGIDLVGTARAMSRNIASGKLVQGGSTLSQQLAKNIFLSQERTITRKILEVAIAIVLERYLNKNEILELYLNEVYLGQEGRIALHGVEAAAKSFFGKSYKDLSLAESALLAGIIRAPSSYSPRRRQERALSRRNLVLEVLKEEGIISDRQFRQAEAEPILLKESTKLKRAAPFFVEAVSRSLDQFIDPEYRNSNQGRVITGLSIELQECAENAVSKGFNTLEKDFPYLKRDKKAVLEAGLVALDPTTGIIRAWVGSRDYSNNQFDHVAKAKRQLGSTIKPFIYVASLDPQLNSYKTANLRTVLPDNPITVPLPNGKVWTPSNADKKFRDRVTVRYALEQSLNLPVIHVTKKIGVTTVQRVLKSFQLHNNPPAVLALALGALDTDLLTLTAAYGAFANEGIYNAPRIFDRIEDSSGKILFKYPELSHKVTDPAPAFLITNILQGAVSRGTGQGAKVNISGVFPAGKTGTSQDGRDAWFVGFTPKIVAGVWVGFDDNRPVRISGGRAAAPIWKNFIECGQDVLDFPGVLKPQEVISVKIDAATDLVATPNCPKQNIIEEFFLKETAPERSCPAHSGSNRMQLPNSRFEQRFEKKQAADKRDFWDRLFGN